MPWVNEWYRLFPTSTSIRTGFPGWHIRAIDVHAPSSQDQKAGAKGMKLENPVRILVADDIAQWRVQIHSILQRNPQLKVVGEACNGLQAVQMTAGLVPDIVLLDIGMPILNGLEAAIEIRQISPATRVIFVTQENDAEITAAALATGAERYVMKANAARELLPAIEANFLVNHYSSTACDYSS